MAQGLTIQLRGVRHGYGSRGARWVFRPQSIEIPAGSHAVIRGSNGSGKSTLGRIVSGQLSPTEGAIHWTNDKVSLPADEVLTRSMVCGPGVALHPLLTIEETVAYHGQFRNWRHGEDPIRELSNAGLSQFLSKRMKDLSSGMYQRVQLALTMMTDSELVVLDEPCANLDREGVAWYRGLLEKAASKTTTVICSNHHEEDYLQQAFFIDL